MFNDKISTPPTGHRLKPGAKIITVSAVELNHKSNHQDFGRYMEADLSITGDAEATLPELIEAVKKVTTSDRRRAMQERGAKIAEAGRRWRQPAGEPHEAHRHADGDRLLGAVPHR